MNHNSSTNPVRLRIGYLDLSDPYAIVLISLAGDVSKTGGAEFNAPHSGHGPNVLDCGWIIHTNGSVDD